jgi:hypothetical protein
MPFTLADAKQLSESKLTHYVIDEFRKSPLLDAMVFDNTVKPQGGNSLAYVYNRVTTLPTAAGRAINSEYTPQEAKTTQITTNLAIFGGSFNLDRAIINNEKQVVDHVKFQAEQKMKATRALFCDQFINGDSATDATAFDGLDKAITGSSTEVVIAEGLDLSGAAKIESGWKVLLYYLRQAIKKMDGAPSIMLMNSDMFAVLQTAADYATGFTRTKNDLGQELLKYGNATLMDAGDKPGTSSPIISTSAIYFARIGLDGLHAVSPDGSSGPTIYLPDMTKPGAVKTGEVEMIAGMALKATRSAAVLRGINL